MTVETMPASPAARATQELEDSAGLDPLVGALRKAAEAVLPGGRLLQEMRGRSLGHALHPIMTDLPIGVWVSATVLDLTGARKHADAARKLVGAGVLLVVPTALTGMADWSGLKDQKSSRLGAVHATLNGVAGSLYATSWFLRRKGRTGLGVLTALAGGGVLAASGYLGGHLTLARQEPGHSGASEVSGPGAASPSQEL
ncbi:DUF2231 domain-containing protein [Puerhibacterium sp. TATVAM-FAB25]|uniref:DUF2231 domain-containing protein n=1 Tax=Puerhibacterium sp. TATVAM-FAB25 TaxID=3093699 RepID=UPI00397B8D24